MYEGGLFGIENKLVVLDKLFCKNSLNSLGS